MQVSTCGEMAPQAAGRAGQARGGHQHATLPAVSEQLFPQPTCHDRDLVLLAQHRAAEARIPPLEAGVPIWVPSVGRVSHQAAQGDRGWQGVMVMRHLSQAGWLCSRRDGWLADNRRRAEWHAAAHGQH